MSWSPLALAVWLGIAGTCLAAEPRPAAAPPALTPRAVEIDRDLKFDLALQAASLGEASLPATLPDGAEARRLESADRRHGRLALHLGRSARAGRSPGDAAPLYGEVGIDLDPEAGLSLVPSYRLVLGEDDSPDADPIGAQVLKLGARIRF